MAEDKDTVYQRKQAEAYCNHIRGLKMRKEAAQANYEEAAASIDGLKAVRYDREGGGCMMIAGDDAVAACLERITKAGDRMVEAINSWVGECEYFDRLCERLTPLSAYILAMRYRNALKWDMVSQRLPYAPEYVRGTLHDRALVELYSVLPMSWK